MVIARVPFSYVVMVPGFQQLIDNTVKEETQSNSNDPKDLGGMKSDKGITKSPIE